MDTPNLKVQQTAIHRLAFLIGKWSGEASVFRIPGQLVDLSQTEEAQFKVSGLVLMIEGVRRLKSDGTPVLEALALISFDDASEKYHMRAFNDGRWLESEVKLLDGRALSWGFTLGEIRTQSVLHINERGEWVEHADLVIGGQPPKKLIDLTVRRISGE